MTPPGGGPKTGPGGVQNGQKVSILGSRGVDFDPPGGVQVYCHKEKKLPHLKKKNTHF